MQNMRVKSKSNFDAKEYPLAPVAVSLMDFLCGPLIASFHTHGSESI